MAIGRSTPPTLSGGRHSGASHWKFGSRGFSLRLAGTEIAAVADWAAAVMGLAQPVLLPNGSGLQIKNSLSSIQFSRPLPTMEPRPTAQTNDLRDWRVQGVSANSR